MDLKSSSDQREAEFDDDESAYEAMEKFSSLSEAGCNKKYSKSAILTII